MRKTVYLFASAFANTVPAEGEVMGTPVYSLPALGGVTLKNERDGDQWDDKTRS
jgi:hypothetical protein